MAYVKKSKKRGMRTQYYYEEAPDSVGIKKGKLRAKISREVSDRDSLIADLFKLNFLTLSALKAVYTVVDKSKIPDDVRDLLDSSFEKYENTETIMDLYIEQNDLSFIDKILKKQSEITKIIKEGYSHG